MIKIELTKEEALVVVKALVLQNNVNTVADDTLFEVLDKISVALQNK